MDPQKKNFLDPLIPTSIWVAQGKILHSLMINSNINPAVPQGLVLCSEHQTPAVSLSGKCVRIH